MRQKSLHPESPSERIVKNIRRATRKRHSSEEKIRIVLDGLRGESSIAELCRREGIAESHYYAWSEEFLEVGWSIIYGRTPEAGKVRCRFGTTLTWISPGRRGRSHCARAQYGALR
jgi:transposase